MIKLYGNHKIIKKYFMGFLIFTWPDLTKKVLEDHIYGNFKIVL